MNDSEAVYQMLQANAKKQNSLNAWRILFGIIQWKYLLLPFGMTKDSLLYVYGDRGFIIHAREVFIFGIRVARWCTGYEKYTLVQDGGLKWTMVPTKDPESVALAGKGEP